MIHSMQRDRERRLRRKPRRKRGLVACLIALTGVALRLGNLLTSPHLEEPTTDAVHNPPGYRPPVLDPAEADARAAAAAARVVDALPPTPRIAYDRDRPRGAQGEPRFLRLAAVLAQSVRSAHKRSTYGAPAFVAFVSPRIPHKKRVPHCEASVRKHREATAHSYQKK